MSKIDLSGALLSKAEIARRLDIHVQTLYGWERGDWEPTRAHLDALRQVLTEHAIATIQLANKL